MPSLLTTTWSQLLAATNRWNIISYHQQDICGGKTFFALMDEMARIGWVDCHTTDGRGCIKNKTYRITFEGALVATAFEGKL